MKSIRFLQDYRGVLTDEKFYRRGAIESVTNEKGNALIDAGRAELVEEEKPKPTRKRAPKDR